MRSTIPTPIHYRQLTAPLKIVLIARLPLGDTLFITPTIEALRARYPTALITAAVAPRNAPLLFHNPDIDDIIVLPLGADRESLGRLVAALRHLTHIRYDVALCFSAPILGWLPRVCNIPRQFFLDFTPLWWLLPHDLHPWNGRHAVEIYADVGRELDLPRLRHQLTLELTPSEQHEIQELLKQLKCTSGRPKIVFHPGSGAAHSAKRWPSHKWVELGRTLREAYGAQILLIGDSLERRLTTGIREQIGERAYSLAGTLTLRQAAALIAQCDLFIGNDSGPLHIATAVGTPVIGIYGPTDPRVFGPWTSRPQYTVIRPAGAATILRFLGGQTLLEHLWSHWQVSTSLALLPVDAVLQAACAHLGFHWRRGDTSSHTLERRPARQVVYSG
ncbi:MAG: glycosyltransferase family 9 protein [Chloroflexi bacterium]|nr:glycosyltransferase family 9 protein [Chloroflexota bacterium]